MFNFFSKAQLSNKATKYSVEDFVFRIKKLEKICIKDGIDGLLIITGIDARENTEYVKLVNWLFLGLSGLEIQESEYLQGIYADMIILIKKGITHIFINPEALLILSPLIYSIPNVDVFCPTEKQNANKDELELLKVAFFLRVMKDTTKIGVLLGKKDNGRLKSIEKWPLIQSYGLQGIGFFSMNHQVQDLTLRINAVYKNYDKYFVSKLIHIVSKRLTGHFTSAAGQLGDLKMHKRCQATELQLTEIFRDTYEIEELSKWVQTRGMSASLPKPRVLFGKNTSANATREPSAEKLSELQYSSNMEAFHATFEAFDLRTCLRAARTYFLAKGLATERNVIAVVNDEDVPQDYTLESAAVAQAKNVDYMANLYLSMIIGFNEVMQVITKDYKNMTEEIIQETIHQRLLKVYLANGQSEADIPKEQLHIYLTGYNSFGEEVKVDFKDTISFKLTPYFFMLRIELSNVQSLVHDDQPFSLGSLVFAESFILQEGCYLLLTKEIPYFDLWNCSNQFSIKIEQLKKRIVWEPLGAQISAPLLKNRIFINTGKKSAYGFDFPIFEANYVYHEKGLRIDTPKLGWILLFFADMKNIQITQSLPNTWMVFEVDTNLVFPSFCKTTIALEFTGDSLQQCLFKIKSTLEENQIPHSYAQEVPPMFTESTIAKKEILKNTGQNPAKLISMNCIQNETFFLSYIESKQLMILNSMKDLKLAGYKGLYENITSSSTASNKNQIAPEVSNNRIGVIFVNGSYCSGKRKFAESLVRFGSDHNLRTHLLKFENKDINELTEKSFLSTLLKFTNEKKVQSTDVIVAAIPHFVNSKIVLDFFAKSEKIVNAFYIRCVVTKININNFYKNDNFNPVENVLVYGVEGYSQFVMLDTYNNYDAEVNAVSKIIAGALPGAQVFKILMNILNPSLAKDILLNTSFLSEINNLSRLKYAVQYDLGTQSERRVVFVPFRLPVSRERLRDLVYKKIMQKGNQTYVDLTNVEKSVAEFSVQYKDSKDEFVGDLLKMKEMIEVQNAQSSESAMKIDFVKAILRYEGKNKDGFEEVTITAHYFIERTVKGVDAQEISKELNGTTFRTAQYKGVTPSLIQDIGFVFGGKNLQADKIQELLAKLTKQLHKQPVRTKADLTEQEVIDLQFRNRGEGLEDGEFYDGQFWRNINGIILPHHPKKDLFIEEYLASEEVRINSINKQLQSEWQTWKSVHDQILLA